MTNLRQSKNAGTEIGFRTASRGLFRSAGGLRRVKAAVAIALATLLTSNPAAAQHARPAGVQLASAATSSARSTLATSSNSGGEVDARFLQLFSSWRQMDRAEIGTASIPSLMPVQGIRFTSAFGNRNHPILRRVAMHAGIDLAGPIGTPIHATADGVVARSGVTGGYGNLVELDHGSGIGTRYGHMSRLLVAAGEHVHRGQVIGLMGSTGRSTGSHLHYEVRIDGHPVNPLPFLQTGEALVTAGQAQGGGAQSGARR